MACTSATSEATSSSTRWATPRLRRLPKSSGGHERIVRVLQRQGRSFDEFESAPDELAQDQPVLASCYGASVGDRQLLGADPGQRTRKIVHPVRELPPPNEALADVGGVNIHAGAAIDGRDRRRLERLCRYVARPPISQERLARHHDGRLRRNLEKVATKPDEIARALAEAGLGPRPPPRRRPSPPGQLELDFAA